jgi:pyruvate dehydrogenase E1 component alpha subunit
MNMAALWKLPVVFCCINNQYGMGTRVDRSAGKQDFPARAEAFGLKAVRADGADVEIVHDATQAIIKDARSGQPGFVEIDAYRFHGHARMDKSPYRTPEEEAAGRKRDPLATARTALDDDTALDTIDAEITKEMDAAMVGAIAAPVPATDTMFQDVYDPTTPAPQPQRARLASVLEDTA